MTYEELDSLCRLARENDYPLSARNEDGENVIIRRGPDRYEVTTAQHNGWLQVITYWKDGTVEEEFTK